MSPDEQEARSFGYVTQQGVIRLRSGLYAIYDRYNYHGQTMPILHIGDWASCEPFVTEYRPEPRPTRFEPPPRPLPTGLQGLDLEIDL